MVERIKVTRLCRIHARSCERNSCRLPNNYVRNLRIILLSISEWYYGRVLLPEIVATLVGFSLIVQGRPIDRYLRGELTEIMNPSRNRYEYTILTKVDGYTGRSSKPIRVTKGSEVRFTIHGRSLYIIDMDGKTQRLRYAVHLTSSAPAPKKNSVESKRNLKPALVLTAILAVVQVIFPGFILAADPFTVKFLESSEGHFFPGQPSSRAGPVFLLPAVSRRLAIDRIDNAIVPR